MRSGRIMIETKDSAMLNFFSSALAFCSFSCSGDLSRCLRMGFRDYTFKTRAEFYRQQK